MNLTEFSQYCATINDTGTWGGEHEILALCRAYNLPIHVAQWGSPPIVVHSPTVPQSDPEAMRAKDVIRISYHKRMYGLGEVSLLYSQANSVY